MVILQLFHQSYLCLLFYGLMSGTVFAHTEGVMRPDELHRKLHQCRQAGGRLDVVAEDEERAASGDHASMQSDTVDDGCHCEFRNAGMQERTLEIMCLKGTTSLEEGVGLVTVGEVGRRHDHVFHLSGQCCKHIGRSGTGGNTGLMGNRCIVHIGHLAVDEVLQLLHCIGILLSPCVDFAFALCNDLPLFLCALCIEFGNFGEHNPGILGISAQMFDGLAVIGTRFAQGVAVGAAFALKVLALGGHGTTSHDGAADDDGGPFFLGQRFVQGIGQCNRVGAVTLDDVPVPCAVLHRAILVADSVTVS